MIRKFKAKKKLPKAILVACKMPPLRHTVSEPFDIQKSEVVAWLTQQPEILNACFGYYKDRGAIAFDPETKLWKGRDHIITQKSDQNDS